LEGSFKKGRKKKGKLLPLLHSADQWNAALLLVAALLFEGMSGGGDGSMVNANIPLAAAATAPTTKAGRFPPPKRASQGPAATETTICHNIIKTIIKLKLPFIYSELTVAHILVYCSTYESNLIICKLNSRCGGHQSIK
jgi:hypothetical protein